MSVEFTAEIGIRACELAAEGMSLEAIAKGVGVNAMKLYTWRKKHPLFSASLDVAREFGMDVLVERMPELALNPDIGPQRARVWCDAIKFRAERQYRQKYGPSVDVTLTERVDLGGAVIEARKRAVLPGSDLAPALQAQETEYAMIEHVDATDTQSAVTTPAVNPFD